MSVLRSIWRRRLAQHGSAELGVLPSDSVTGMLSSRGWFRLKNHGPSAGIGSMRRSSFPTPDEVRHAHTDLRGQSENQDADKKYREDTLVQSRTAVVFDLFHGTVPLAFVARLLLHRAYQNAVVMKHY
jgi:hypothetical protein